MDIVRLPDGGTRRRPGGSPANVAVGLSRLGVPTDLLCCLGHDAHGDELRTHLDEAGVRLSPTAAEAIGRTSTAEAAIGLDGAASYEFDIHWDPGPFTTGPVRLLHTGSLATVIEPGASEVIAALASAAPGTLISFDPNVRPSLGLPPELVRERIELIARKSHLVKLSDEDVAWLYPDSSIAQVCTHLHTLGVQLVVITRGALGCTMSTPHWSTDLPALPTSVVDTIGAGDAFMSGLLFAILNSNADTSLRSTDLRQDVCESWAHTALRCAAITVGRAGAQPPFTEELARYGEAICYSAAEDRTVPSQSSPSGS